MWTDNNRKAYIAWLLTQITATWNTFASEFTQLWNNPELTASGYYSQHMFPTDESRTAVQAAYLKRLLSDSLGFAGAKMVRELLSIQTQII
jgi:5-methylthioribose kinase